MDPFHGPSGRDYPQGLQRQNPSPPFVRVVCGDTTFDSDTNAKLKQKQDRELEAT